MYTLHTGTAKFFFPKLGTGYVISASSTSAPSAALPVGEYGIQSDVDVWIKQGSDPTAIWQTAPSIFLPAGELMTFRVDTDGANKIAAVTTGSSTGKVSIFAME